RLYGARGATQERRTCHGVRPRDERRRGRHKGCAGPSREPASKPPASHRLAEPELLAHLLVGRLPEKLLAAGDHVLDPGANLGPEAALAWGEFSPLGLRELALEVAARLQVVRPARAGKRVAVVVRGRHSLSPPRHVGVLKLAVGPGPRRAFVAPVTARGSAWGGARCRQRPRAEPLDL